MDEKSIQNRILKNNGSNTDIRLFRNNVGMATFPNGSRVVYGLCSGSSDLIGMKRVLITQDMVGDSIAQFVAVEVKKKKGKPTQAQKKFLDMVEDMGGIAILTDDEGFKIE